jgi:hypothetical protein
MSSIAKRLAKKAKQTPEEYTTLVGSIVTTIGIITGQSEHNVRKMYNRLKKDKKDFPNTVGEIFNYVWSIFGDDDKIAVRANVVLVYDKLNVRSPLVTWVNENGNIMPLSPNGTFTGILMTAAAGSEYVGVEYLYNEDGSEIIEEENKIDE